MDHMAVGMDVDVAVGVESRNYAPMRVVLPEVRHWKLVESYRLQTLCECRERRRGYPAVVNSGKITVLEKTLAGMGDDEPILAGKKVLEKELKKLQKKLNGPKKNGKAHRGQTKLDQQRIQTPRGGICKIDGIAREPQRPERNIESGLRGNQDSQRGPSERGRNDTTRTGILERVGFEETGWVDRRRFSGGNRWLDDGGPETQQRSRSKKEKTARDDREGIKERCQNGRCHGRFGWFSVVMRVHTRTLQTVFECKQHEKEKKSGLSNAVTDPVSLKVLSWNVAGLAEDCTDIFLSQISMFADWDMLLLQECFRRLDGVNVGAHELFTLTLSELLGGLRCPAVIVNRKWKGQSKIVEGAARWTAVELDGQLTLISAHLPHKGKNWENSRLL